MWRLFFLVFAALCLQGFDVSLADNWIDPTGIRGTLVLTTSLDASSMNEFTKRMDPQDEVLIVVSPEIPQVEVEKVIVAAFQSGIPRVRIRNWESPFSRDRETKDVPRKSHVWFLGEPKDPVDFSDKCQEILDHGGSVALCGRCLGFAFEDYGVNASELAKGWSLLPKSRLAFGAHARSHSRTKGASSKLLTFHFPERSNLVINGRRFYSTNKAAPILSLPASSHNAQNEYSISSAPADLIAAYRAAQTRRHWPFSTDTIAPQAKHGTLILAGGGKLSDEIVGRFVELAGGVDSRIIIFPTAAPDPLTANHWMAPRFERLGAGQVDVLPQRDRQDVESEAFLQKIDQATAIWFGGGRQWRFVDAYANTKAAGAIRRVLERGGVVGGSSAGASIQAEYLARGNPLGNLEIMSEGYEQGFNFLSGVAVDQHFSQRNRLPQLQQLVRRFPQFLGIGLDESTAIEVTNATAKVLGTGGVFLIRCKEGKCYTLKKTANEGTFRLDMLRFQQESDLETNPDAKIDGSGTN